MTVIDKIGKMLPNVVLDHVILENQQTSLINSNPPARAGVMLHFHIDDYFYSDGTSTWETDDDYKGKLFIQCIQKKDGAETLLQTISAASHEPVGEPEINEINKITFKQRIMVDSDFGNNMTITLRTFMASTTTGVEWGEVTPIDIIGTPSSVEVIRNGTAQTRVLGYFLGDSFYNGPKTQLANGRWVTGEVQSPASQPLIERNVPNIRLFDERNLVKVQNLSSTIVDASADSQGVDTNLLPNFSNISATRDSNNTLRYLFTLDYSSAYESKTLYPDVYRNLSNTLKDRLLRMSKIKSLTLFRKRQGYSDMVDEIIASSGETSGDNFIDTETELGSIKEEDFSFNEGLQYRSFSGVDKTFETITAGKYQYRVSADIQDGIYTFLSFQIADLAASKQLLDEYVAFYPSHNPTTKQISDYVTSVNERTDFLNRPYIRALISLSESVYFLSGINGDLATRLINSFRSYLSPVTGTLETLQAVQGIYNLIAAELEEKMELVRNGAANALENPNASRGNTLYNIEEVFSSVFDATESFKNGISFISPKASTTNNGIPGLFSITSTDFESRMSRENKNFFKSNNVTFSLGTGDSALYAQSEDTSYSFLTPVSFRVGDIVYTAGSSATQVSPDGGTAESLFGSASENKYRRVLSSLRNSRIADSGVGVENLDITPVAESDYETEAPLGEQNPENQTSISIDNLSNSLSDAGFDNPLTALVLEAISTDEEGSATLSIIGLDGKPHTVSFEEFNKGFPNYFKAILSGEVPLGDSFSEIYSEATNGNVAPYGLIFGSLARLDILTGFSSDSGGVRNPSYVPLTSKLYNQNAGKKILCRVSKFENSKLGFSRSNNAPIYNHFFSLECPPAGLQTGSGLQTQLNAASTLDDINRILESYGISTSGQGAGAAGGTDIGVGACAAIADEKAIEEMAGFIESTPEPLNLLPLTEGEPAPFDGILMNANEADAIVSERDALAQELKELQGDSN